MAKSTEYSKAYTKASKAIKLQIKRMTARGYIFVDQDYNPLDILGKRPTEITKSDVEAIEKITTEELYKKAQYVSPTTGEIVSGTEGRKFENTRRTVRANITKNIKKQGGQLDSAREAFYEDKSKQGNKGGSIPKQSAVVMSNVASIIEKIGVLDSVQDTINNWTPQSHWSAGLAEAKRNDVSILGNILQGAINSEGEALVAQRMEMYADEIISLVEEILYGSGSKEGTIVDGRTQVNLDLVRFSTIITGRALTVEESIAITEQSERYEYE